MMRILVVHNRYQTPGGEDKVFDAESALLEERGHSVDRLVVHNDSIRGFATKLRTMLSTRYSGSGRTLVDERLSRFRPDIVHVHNFFPLISPAVFYACGDAGVPVVHTLHNYRIICPSGLLMIRGKIYEKSLRHSAYWSVPRRAYRDSFPGTWASARMVEYHKKMGTWRSRVDRFIALTEFARAKFVEAGLPAEKIAIKPNFIADPAARESQAERHGALFVGRLGHEKGLGTLLEAWRGVDCKLTVAGDGPLAALARTAPRNVDFVGYRDPREIGELMQRSMFLVLPSESFEGFPIVLLEAYAHRLPIVASRLGGLAELVVDGVTGLHFEARQVDDLVVKITWMIEHPAERGQLGQNARKLYEDRYTAQENYAALMQIYGELVGSRC